MHPYGRVTELSWLLNADTEAAEVMLSGRVFHWVMVLGTRISGTGSWNSEGSSVSVSLQFLEPVCLQISDSDLGALVTPPHAHEGLCTGRRDSLSLERLGSHTVHAYSILDLTSEM